MEFEIVVLPSAEKDLDNLDSEPRRRILERIEWLGANADQVSHHRLQGMPEELSGLCRFRVGDYRVLYWKQEKPPRIQMYRVRHRSEAYKFH